MDPVTHGLLGAVSAGFVSLPKHKTKRWPVLAAGAAGALAPDLDVFIYSASDPLLQLEFHRFFTHSLLFAPIGALFVSGILWLFLKRRITFISLWSYALIGMLTAGLGDAWTSYGTQLVWPVTDERIAWNLISVFDPLFTIGILGGFIWSVISKHKRGFFLSIVWALLYLNWAAWNQNRVLVELNRWAAERGHVAEYVLTKPTIANNWLWSGKYVSDNVLYTAGFHILPWSEITIYEGEEAPLLDISPFSSDLSSTLSERQLKDVERFSALSDGILIPYPGDSLVIGDGRYAMLPTSVKPLWGIRLNPENPESHVTFEEFRSTDAETINQFKKMLMGN